MMKWAQQSLDRNFEIVTRKRHNPTGTNLFKRRQVSDTGLQRPESYFPNEKDATEALIFIVSYHIMDGSYP